MNKQSKNYWLGLIIGAGFGQLLLSATFRHSVSMELFLFWPLLFPLTGALGGMKVYKKLGENAPKTIPSIFIFCLLAGAIFTFSGIREKVIEWNHEKTFTQEVSLDPNSTLILKRFSLSDGFDNEDSLAMHFATNEGNTKEILGYYSQNLLRKSWKEEWVLGDSAWFTKKEKGHLYGLKIVLNPESNKKYSIFFSIH